MIIVKSTIDSISSGIYKSELEPIIIDDPTNFCNSTNENILLIVTIVYSTSLLYSFILIVSNLYLSFNLSIYLGKILFAL